MSASLVLPVGLPLGPLHLPGAAGPAPLMVARGAVEEPLDPAEAAVWTLLHDLGDSVLALPALRGAAADAGGAEAAAAVDRLLARGLVVEVGTRAVEVLAFARAHRVRPLLLGLGNTPERPADVALGLVGSPVLWVTARLAARWADAVLWPDLATAAAYEVARVRGAEAHPSDDELAGEVWELVPHLPTLVGRYCGWIDVASRLP